MAIDRYITTRTVDLTDGPRYLRISAGVPCRLLNWLTAHGNNIGAVVEFEVGGQYTLPADAIAQRES